MGKNKLVPMEPTEAMIEAARDQHEGEPYLPVSLYKAMIAAAPAVQGEPVAWIVRHPHFCGKFTDDKEIAAHWESKKQGCTTPLFHCSQPVEQQECGCCGQTVKCDDDCDAVVLRKAEQRPELAAPAVQGEPVGYVSPRLLDALRTGKACGITMEDKPDAHNGVTIPLYTAPQPAKQPEAKMQVVGWQFYQDGKWWNGDDRIKDHRKNTVAAGIPVRDVYTTPQPAEQQPDVALLVEALEGGPLHPSQVRALRRNVKRNCPPEIYALLDQAITAPQPVEQQPSAGDSLTSVPDEVFAAEFAAWWEEHGQFCRAGGGTYERTFAFEAWRHLYPQLMNLQMAAAEQHPAPDVSGLVEALEAALMVMTSKEVRLEKQADAITMVRSQLAAHRRQGGK